MSPLGRRDLRPLILILVLLPPPSLRADDENPVTENFKCRLNGCCDQHEWCHFWASQGECYSNRLWMEQNCQLACNTCSSGGNSAALKAPRGTICDVKCRRGYRRVVGDEQGVKSYSCSADGKWSPQQAPSACVPIGREPARYELKAAITYAIDGALSIDDSCLKGYEYLAEANFDSIDMVLSQRCSSSVQVLVRTLSVKFQRVSWAPESRLLRANYYIQESVHGHHHEDSKHGGRHEKHGHKKPVA